MPDPFIDQQDLSDVLGRDVTQDNGALIAIDAACDVCRSLTGQLFNKGTATATLDGTGTDTIVLPQFPVSSAGTVLVNGGTVTDYVLSENGMLFRKFGSCDGFGGVVGGVAGGIGTGGPVWPYGRQNVQVTYEYGYDDASFPRDVRLVALALAERLVVQGVAQSETIGDVQVNYGMSADDLTPGEKLILSGYVRRRGF